MSIWDDICSAMNAGVHASAGQIVITGTGSLPSYFDVTGMAVNAIGAAGVEVARFLAGSPGEVTVAVDRRLASMWFGHSLRPIGWQTPNLWDPISGDYRTRDGWIRLHTNAPRHRGAALSVLGKEPDRDGVAKAVASWETEALETEIVAAGGCSAAMRSLDAWGRHPQGKLVAGEPLITWHRVARSSAVTRRVNGHRPLQGIKALDLTRVLAGPVATRFLAAFGADVLRIDPPDWGEPGIVPELTAGKRCAKLDLKELNDRPIFESLVRDADILIHGYRPGALAGLGYGEAFLRELNPALIDVSLSAYGWSGPYGGRRGFDSLVQMSAGIAEAGMRIAGADRPMSLPVQALDHATGYLMAAAAVRSLWARRNGYGVFSARLSLARRALFRVIGRPRARYRRDRMGPRSSTNVSDNRWRREAEIYAPCRGSRNVSGDLGIGRERAVAVPATPRSICWSVAIVSPPSGHAGRAARIRWASSRRRWFKCQAGSASTYEARPLPNDHLSRWGDRITCTSSRCRPGV